VFQLESLVLQYISLLDDELWSEVLCLNPLTRLSSVVLDQCHNISSYTIEGDVYFTLYQTKYVCYLLSLLAKSVLQCTYLRQVWYRDIWCFMRRKSALYPIRESNPSSAD
jgi:hypothetical protein